VSHPVTALPPLLLVAPDAPDAPPVAPDDFPPVPLWPPAPASCSSGGALLVLLPQAGIAAAATAIETTINLSKSTRIRRNLREH
jgi:hypothetical protein